MKLNIRPKSTKEYLLQKYEHGLQKSFLQTMLLFFSLFFVPTIAAQVTTSQTEANQWLATADSLSEIESYQEAGVYYEKLVTHYLKHQAPDSVVNVLTQAIINWQNANDSEKAVALFDSVFQQVDTLAVPKAPLALLYNKHGVSHYNLDQAVTARYFLQKALLLRETFLPPTDTEIIRGYRNIGIADVALKDYQKAQTNLEKALDLQLANPQKDTNLLYTIHENLGLALQKQEDFGRAEEHLHQVLVYAKEIYHDEPWEIGRIYNSMSYLFLEQNRANAMFDYAQKALGIYQSIGEKYDEDWWGVADSYNNIGIAQDLNNQLEKAEANFRKSIDINQRFDAERATSLADNYNNLALIFRKQKRYKDALLYQNKAFLIYTEQNDPLSISDSYHNFGKIYERQNKLEKALHAHQQSLNYAVIDFDSDDMEDNPSTEMVLLGDRPNLVENLQAKAQVLRALFAQNRQQNTLENAAIAYRRIAQFLDVIKTDFDSDESKTFLTNKAKKIYDEAVQVSLDLYEATQDETYLTEAFQYIERSKAIILLDAFEDAQAKARGDIPRDLLDKELELKKKITHLETQIRDKIQDESLVTLDLRQDLIIQKVQLQHLHQKIIDSSPEYAALQAKQHENALQRAQHLLQANEGLIQYFVGETEIIIFYLTPDARPIYQRVPLDFSLSNWIRGMRTGIHEPFVGTRNVNQDSLHQIYVENAHQLYQKLIQPIAQNQDLAPKIYLIPDGVLGYIPFDALLKATVSNKNYANYPYFGKDHILSYAYSANLLDAMQQAVVTAQEQGIVAFAPQFSGGNELAPLLYNRQEVEQIMERVQGKSFLAEAASKANFLQRASAYPIIHLSSHARTNDTLPNQSFIAFSQLNSTIDEAELLRVYDLYSTRLQAEMIVLSACETGLGKLEKGEGIISLARAFAYAGAKSIMTTLWRVNDQRTTEIMTDFYENIGEKQTKDQALWKAKQKMIAGGLYAHPYYWAGFIPIGNMESLTIQKPTNSLLIGIGGILCLLLLVLGYFFITRTKKK